MIHEERNALQRPVEESEYRIADLRKTLEDAERAMRDLGALLTAEQQHLSEIFAQRRKAFLKQAPKDAQEKLSKALASVRPWRNGPAYRRAVNHLAQEIARTQLAPWLESEAKFADDAFRATVRRFVEMGNNFLLRVADTSISGPPPLPDELDPEQGLEAQSHFYFHVMERIAAPASPFLLLADLLRGSLGLRNGIISDARDFLNHLLEVNSAQGTKRRGRTRS